MTIYIQSRGYSQDFDYCWQLNVPKIIKDNKVNELIQSESPSLVLARYESELLLLITGLKSSRSDFGGRIIRNSVAWVENDSEESERKLRAIATGFLRGLLKDDIDKAITFGNDYDFEVDFEKIRDIKIEEVSNFDFKSERKIAKNSQRLKEDLAYELEQRCLPKGKDFSNTPLVVVTGIKSEDTLKQAGVWRGLSNLVKSEEWKYYNLRVQENSELATKKEEINLILLIGFIALIPILLILFLWLKPKP